MKIDLTEQDCRNIKIGLLEAIRQTDKSCKQIKFDDNPLIKELLKLHDKIDEAIEKEKNKIKSDPFDPYKKNYYAKLGYYQQLHAANMMGLKSEASLVKYRKNGVLKENIHWIRTVGRGISYKPEACKLAIRKVKLGY
tara:strand:+ start:71 stop:484 length:414 start_codon:yes stop_codon:yes gene_type:complete